MPGAFNICSMNILVHILFFNDVASKSSVKKKIIIKCTIH